MNRRKSKKKTPAGKEKAPAAKPATWRDRLSIGLWITTPIVLTGVLFIGSAKSQWNRSIDDRLAKWQQAYQLSDETVEIFRRIELEFHGSGNPLPAPSAVARRKCRLITSKWLNSSAGRKEAVLSKTSTQVGGSIESLPRSAN